MPSPRKLLACAFLILHPLLFRPYSTNIPLFGNWYSTSHIPTYFHALILATLFPTITALLEVLLATAPLPTVNPLRGKLPDNDKEEKEENVRIEGMRKTLNLQHTPEKYGLTHAILNLKLENLWANMGYWKDTKDFTEANMALTKRVAEAAQVRAGDKVLDVGYGCGDQDIYIHREYNPGEIIGITIEPTQARVARARIRDLNLQKRVRLYLGDAAKLGEFCKETKVCPEENAFDRILSIDSAYHFNTRESFLAQAFKALRPGARIAMTDIIPARKPESPLEESMLRLFCYLGEIPLANMVTPDQYHATLVGIGYEDIRLEYIEDDVFPGLMEFTRRQQRICRGVLSPGACLKLQVVTWILDAVHQSKACHFILASAKKPHSKL